MILDPRASRIAGRRWRLVLACAASALALALVGCRVPPSIGDSVQDDAHPPQAWRKLTAAEQARFDLGYAVFNTDFVPADRPPGRTDGLGPLFNSPGCDRCHNSRRRGRGPLGDGEAPSDLVMQLGTLLPDGRVMRGTQEYGYILNTAGIEGFRPEARVSIRYEDRVRAFADGASVELRLPHYHIDTLSGPPLPQTTVLMPRLAPPVQGDGLLELAPRSELADIAFRQSRHRDGIHGRIPLLGSGPEGPVGRFGWQSTEPSVASQIGSAFAREMGLTNPLVGQIDCGEHDRACQAAPTGGTPEIQPEIFNAVVTFERLHAVPVQRLPDLTSPGGRLFVRTGCAECHLPTLRAEVAGSPAVLHPYTDLLLHDMGEALADRDLAGEVVSHEAWRTAPLWGMNAAYATGQQPRLLHDGRARSIDEAILWHEGEGAAARDRFARLSAEERRTLTRWVEDL